MASIVLGKRARATEDFSSPSPRVKRRGRVQILADENANPNAIQDKYSNGHDGDYMDLDGLEDPFITPSKSSQNVSPKSGASKKRLVLSPTNANNRPQRPAPLLDNKQSIQLATPQTPRHRDALSKKVPVTPRHRLAFVGKPTTPRTPRTPSTPSNAPTIYNDARQLFVRSGEPGRLVGRDEERAELNRFIRQGIESGRGRCLYVSGPPGTGKSALVNEVCNEIRDTDGVRMAYVNCMSVKGANDIYSKLIEDLNVELSNEWEDELAVLRKTFSPKKKSNGPIYVVTLDEIDHLLTLDLEILYTLFEWSLQRSSRLVLVGIANALDLTDRFLPRLKSRNPQPQLLPFLPYTAPQVASILTAKLKSIPLSCGDQSDLLPFVHPTAVQLCSKKVAAQTGDLRKAFDIMRRAIDLVENEARQRSHNELISPSKPPLGENPNLSSPPQPKTLSAYLSSLTPATAPRVTIAHIARVTSAALGNGTPQRLQNLNLQQKAALCALISLEKSTRSAARPIFMTPSKPRTNAPTIRRLYEAYTTLCNRENALHPLTKTEFADVISGLETLGLVGDAGRGFALAKGRGTPSKKMAMGKEDRSIVSWVAEKELEGCLEGAGGGILKGLLKGDED